MSKKVKCPSCDMAGDLDGDDYKLVTTYRRRPVVQCFWCDSHVMIRRVGAPVVLDLSHKAIRHLRSDLDHDEMVSLLLDEEEEVHSADQLAGVTVLPAAEQVAAAVEAEPEPAVRPEPEPAKERIVAVVENERPAPKRKKARKVVAEPEIRLADYEPAMLADAAPAVLDNTPAVLNPEPEVDATPIPGGAELVSSIPVTARALDHDSLISIAARVGWNYTPTYKQPEWLHVLSELPPPVVMGKYRTKLQNMINMMKYFRINAGSRDQRRAEAQARRLRLVEYRKRMFEDKLEALNAIPAIEYKAKAI